jgi:hypothetical protein
MLCLYFMGLNLSNAHIAKELDLNKDDVHQMTSPFRQGIVAKTPSPPLRDEVACAEVSIVAGHTGPPEEVVKKGGLGGADDAKANEGEESLQPRSRRSSE